jgi:hypothetical protein
MKTAQSSKNAQEVPGYAQLQRQIHVALRAQHPEWVLPNGDSPTCDSYELRFAELLRQTEEDRTLTDGSVSCFMPSRHIETRNIVFHNAAVLVESYPREEDSAEPKDEMI